MNQWELKNKILATNYFEDNEYLDKYCELIINNLETKSEKYKTQSHHILPKCYFLLINAQIDNSEENLVNLLYKNHLLSHYYLALSCKNRRIFEKLNKAFVSMSFAKTKLEDFDLTMLDQYQYLYEEYCDFLKNTPNISNQKYHDIYCLELDEMFDSTFEIRKKYPNLDINAITSILKYNSLNPKYQTCNGTHWCYGIKNKKESKIFLLKILNDLDNLPNINSKPVQSLETGDVYESATVAAIAVTGKENSNISCSAWYFSKGKNKIAFGSHWVYLEDINNPYTKEERYQLLKSLPYAYSGRMKLIQNLNTGKVYKGFKELKSALGIKDISGLSRACKCTKEGYNSIAYGYNWIYIDDKPYTKEECNSILKNLKPFTTYNAKKVINLETGEIFNSTAEADIKYSKKHNRTGAVLIACDRYIQGKSNIAHGYHWCYLDDIKDNSLECREKILLRCLNTKMPINNKRVQNLETGEVYNKYQDAGFEFINNPVGAAELISKAVKNTSNNCGAPVKGLYHYIKLEYNASPYTKQERIEILNNLDYSKTIMVKDLNRNITFFSYQEVANYYNITRWEVDKYKIDPKYNNGLKLKFLSPDEIKEHFILCVK